MLDLDIKWDERYRTGDLPWDTGKTSGELMRVIAEEKILPCKALELGCGTGTNSIWLAQQGFDMTAVDISPAAIQRARDIASKVAVRFLVADVLAPLKIEDRFAFFFDRGCYHVVRRVDVAAYLHTLDTLLSSGAQGLILAGNAKEPSPPHQGPPYVSEDELRSELGQLFDIKQLREFRFDSAPSHNENFLAWSILVRKKAERAKF
jgi:SAM-dependent methyltransferase